MRQPRIKSALLALAVGCVPASLPASAGVLTGKFVVPSTGPVVNGTLLLTLSQAAIEPGSFAVAPATVACATSIDGSVVGAANPLATPAGAAISGTGTLPAGIYFVEIVYTGTGGTTTLVSPEAAFTLSAAGELQIHAPTGAPAAATGYSLYIGTSSGAETLQGTSALTANYLQTAPLASGAAPPFLNTTVCAPIFNDALIPAFTTYQATLADASSNTLAGFPESWYLAGSAVDVSAITPLASNPAPQFPMPVLENPATAAAQSIGSNLNLNGYSINAAGNFGPGFFSSFWSGTLPAPTAMIGGWTPNVGVWVRRMDLYAQTAGSGGSAGLTIVVSDGTNACSFGGLLAAGTNSSSATPTGVCSFGAGIPLSIKVTGDDHTTAPGNVSFSLELTSR